MKVGSQSINVIIGHLKVKGQNFNILLPICFCDLLSGSVKII